MAIKQEQNLKEEFKPAISTAALHRDHTVDAFDGPGHKGLFCNKVSHKTNHDLFVVSSAIDGRLKDEAKESNTINVKSIPS